MKKKYLIALSILVIIGALIWFREPIVKAAGGAFGLNSDVSQPRNTDGVVSTSTLNYLTPGSGTTTITAFTGGADKLDLNIFMVASSTSNSADLRWTVEFSHSTSSVASQQLWYPLTENLNSTATTTFRTQIAKEFGWKAATSTRHVVATSTFADSTFTSPTASTRISIEDIAARWTRVIFYIPTIGTTLNESTALGSIPTSTSTNAGIQVFIVQKEPL